MGEFFTKHEYIGQYPIELDSRKLILGTIHAMNPAGFKLKFFYGSRGTLWNILYKAFPDELTDPTSVASIRSFLQARKIAMSDVIAACDRKRKTALDADLINIQLHQDLLPQIRRSAITDIYFTSGLAANGAFRLFYTGLLKQRITDGIRGKREFELDEQFFGRPVRLHILHSPSGAANISLSKHPDFLASIYADKREEAPVQAFKIDYYRRMFAKDRKG